jgi:hypothetical protein
VNPGGGGSGGAAPSQWPPGIGWGALPVLSGEGALASSGGFWPGTKPALAAGSALLPPTAEAITTGTVLHPLDMTSIDRFFAADDGRGRRAFLPRPRPEAAENISRGLADFWPEWPPLALE